MMNNIKLVLAAAIAGGFFMLVFRGVAVPKDNSEQWQSIDPQTRQWFRGLKNSQGVPCCSEVDGHRIDEWRIDDFGKVLVTFGGREFEVPHDKVLFNTPNRIGVAILWISDSGHIYCFLPSALG